MNKFILGLIFTSVNVFGMTGKPAEILPPITNASNIKLFDIQKKGSTEVNNRYNNLNKKNIIKGPNQISKKKIQNDGIYHVTFSGEKHVRYNPKEAKLEIKKFRELAKVEELLKRVNAHPDQIMKNDETIMVNAVKETNLELVKFLLDQGANPNQVNRYGISLLSLAYINHDLDTMHLLLNKCVRPDNSTILGCSLLFIAYIENRLDTMELLLQYGANPDRRGCFGSDSILIEAIQDKNFEIVELLLKYGADPNQTNIFGQTPALLAIKQRDSKITKLLFDYGGRLYFFKKN